MQIRSANEKDIEQLRRLYLELEADGVKYQPEHFVIGFRSDDFSTQYLKVIIRIFLWQMLTERLQDFPML